MRRYIYIYIYYIYIYTHIPHTHTHTRVCVYIYIYIYTYGNGFTTGGLKRGRIQAMPAGQEILDVGSSGVHDAKTRDVDGAVLDHLALPSVVHYLITARYTRAIGI